MDIAHWVRVRIRIRTYVLGSSGRTPMQVYIRCVRVCWVTLLLCENNVQGLGFQDTTPCTFFPHVSTITQHMGVKVSVSAPLQAVIHCVGFKV